MHFHASNHNRYCAQKRQINNNNNKKSKQTNIVYVQVIYNLHISHSHYTYTKIHISQMKYENLVSGTAPVESHLHKHLAEHLNSEIVLSTISNIDNAMEWIRSTFFYVRAMRNPKNYDLPIDGSQDQLEAQLKGRCLFFLI